jgi:hypothetical protein
MVKSFRLGEVALVGGLGDLSAGRGNEMLAVAVFNYTGTFALKLRKTHRKLSDGTRKVPGTFLSTLSPFFGQPRCRFPFTFGQRLGRLWSVLSRRHVPYKLPKQGGIPRTTQLWVAIIAKRPDVEGKKVYTPIPPDLLVTNVPSCGTHNVKILQF